MHVLSGLRSAVDTRWELRKQTGERADKHVMVPLILWKQTGERADKHVMVPLILCLFVTASTADPRTRFVETRNVTVTVGDTAVLPCAVSDLNNYKVVWVDQFRTVLTVDDRRIINDLRISVERPYMKDWNLHIRDVRLSDSGVYECEASTSPFKTTSVFLTVTVAGQDVVTSWRPRYDGHDVMNGSMSNNVTWASGQGSERFLAKTHSLLLSAALVNWVCWF